jgi:hypothetical protein
MQISLDFIPDTIVYFRRINGSKIYAVRRLWGEKEVFLNAKDFFTEMIPKHNKSVILCIQKNTLRFQIFEIKEQNDKEE